MEKQILREDTKVMLAYASVCIIWGSTYLAIRIGVANFPPELFAGIRFVLSGLLMMLYCKSFHMEFPKTRKDIINQSIVGIMLLTGGNGLVVWTEQWVSSGAASLIVATAPLFMAIIEACLPNGSRLSPKGWLGLLIGFSGVAVLVLSKSGSASIDPAGGILLMLAALLWAGGSVYSKTFKSEGSMLANVGVQMLAAGIALSIIGLSLGELGKVTLNIKGVGAMVYLILFGSMLGYTSYLYILQKWPAAKAGTYAYVNPLVAVLLGAVILKEPLSFNVVVSTAVILAGVLLVQTSKTKKIEK